MELLIERLQKKLADAETTLDNTDPHDDLGYGKAQGVVAALTEALNMTENRYREERGFWP
jgi:methylphosphotriester-DNA--protein-cysteine methyltransferase